MRRIGLRRVGLTALAAMFLLSGQGQEKPRLTFDVASIHPSAAGQDSGGIKALPGGMGYTARNIPVKLMISLMYKVPMRQIKGGPEWMGSEGFDVEARADHAYSVDDLHTMYRNLLADRFGLKFHTETKEGPVYGLTVDPGGLKMKASERPEDYGIPMLGGPAHTVGRRVPMDYLCWFLGLALQDDERPVIDRTGLTGKYDFTLSFRPELAPGVTSDHLPPELRDLPTIFTAVREQLGLRLQAEKGPVEWLVIDQVEKPSAN